MMGIAEAAGARRPGAVILGGRRRQLLETEMVDDSLFDNPFTPGYGIPPPYLAGRDEERRRIYEVVGATASRRCVAKDVIIYGPRGTGKTALLRDISHRIETEHKNATILLIPAIDLEASEDVGKLLIREVGRPLWEAMKPESFGLNWQGLEAKWNKGDLSLSSVRKGLSAKCERNPLIILVDEAHTLDSEVCRKLFNEAQTIRGIGGPMVVVLAGKPQLVGVGNRSDVSFIERGETISVGLLDGESSAQAISIPLRRERMEIEGEALKRLVDDAQGYPHYLQLWGSEIWKLAKLKQKNHIDSSDISVVMPNVRKERDAAYAERFNSWMGQDRLLLQKITGRLSKSGMVAEPRMEEMITEELKIQGRQETEMERIYGKMVETDYVWRIRGDKTLMPSIPSFFGFLREAERQKIAERKRESRRGGAGS